MFAERKNMNAENKSITEDRYAGSFGFEYIAGGGVATALGFEAAGVHAGFRANPNRKDLAIVVASDPVPTAGVFTQNEFCAAPVQYCRKCLSEGAPFASYGTARAVMVNSGNANAATGIIGLERANEEAALLADAIGCPEDEVLVASTGVIGVQLPIEPFECGIPMAMSALSREGSTDAAQAILTTDLKVKQCAVRISGEDIGYPGTEFVVGGMAKGSGMIMPNMATMIAVLTTDAPLLPADLHAALKSAVDVSFNKITVDSDTSTNDSCFLMASGAAVQKGRGQNAAKPAQGHAQVRPIVATDKAYAVFVAALKQVCITLARAMALDGEGATCLVTVNVCGAKDEEDADLAARTVANSPLVKTAIAGRDANWGRIAAALGRSGAQFSQENVSIDIMGMNVCKDGLSQPFDEDEALRRFEGKEIAIDVDLGEGAAETTIWTCDMTHDYISINADYRS